MDIAVLGFGTVGSGVAEVFYSHHESLLKKTKQKSMEIKYILDKRDFPGSPFESKVVKDFNIILNDEDIGVVVECMGGLEPAASFVSAALRAGKHVVTSNKEMVAEKGAEFLRLAQKHGVNFLFEASVGGGIPIIRPLSQCLAANDIDEIAGILNGTTNFILTRMINDKMGFDEALKIAQDNGYAERDPSADVDGHDTCRKICILASLSFGRHVYPGQVHTEGIRSITPEDVEYAENFGGAVKLLGMAKRLPGGKISASVGPAFVKRQSQLAGVEDVFNAILVRGDAIGDVVFYGRGAGKLPTASAVVADVIDCVNHHGNPRLLGWEDGRGDYVEDPGKCETRLYVRALADIFERRDLKDAFPGATRLIRQNAPEDEVAFVTPPETEDKIKQKLIASKAHILNTIRVTDY